MTVVGSLRESGVEGTAKRRVILSEFASARHSRIRRYCYRKTGLEANQYINQYLLVGQDLPRAMCFASMSSTSGRNVPCADTRLPRNRAYRAT